MPKALPSKLYNADPRAVLKSRKESIEEEKKKRLAIREAKRKKEMGKDLVMLTKWKKDMGKLMSGIGSSDADGPQVPLSASFDATATSAWQMNSSGVLNDDSLVTEYSETDPRPMQTPLSSPQHEMTTNQSPSSSPPTKAEPQAPAPAPTSYELLKWKAEARLFASQADEFLSPIKKPKEEEGGKGEEKKEDTHVRLERRQTTIVGESNEFVVPAIDPNTTLPVSRDPNFQAISFNTTATAAMALDQSVMSQDKLEDDNLFHKKTKLQRKLLSPNVVTGAKETILVHSKSPKKKVRSQTANLPALYKMSWPVIPNPYEMEKFQKENENLKKRILVARGRLSPRVLEEKEEEAPYALGETPLQPRTGGIIEPQFYGINRNESPVRIPNSHYSFWQQHSKVAPKMVEMGLGVMSFEIPDVDLEMSPDKNSTTVRAEMTENYFANVENYVKAQNEGFLDDEKVEGEGEGEDVDAKKKNDTSAQSGLDASQIISSPPARRDTMTSMNTALTGQPNSPFAMSKVPRPERKASLFGEAFETLDVALDSNIGKGLYHDTTASVLAAPLSAHHAVPQIQPFGFEPTKPRLRVLAMTDALKYQGELTPRTKLHHFQMFPYGGEAHEAAFVIQRFWGRYIRMRAWAVTLVQCHFRRLRARRDFLEYIRKLQFARRVIGEGARKWLARVHLTRDSEIGTQMVIEELAKQLTEEWYEEEKVEQFWKNAMLSLVYRYRWKRRMKKRRKRRSELEEVCATRMQRGARYFLVTRMLRRWNDAHIVIKRSFRAYFLRAYKKQLR
ncbi:hypothetical protein TrCOL_g3855 [Triparma columacea]|uniref:Uncharacterized protein n=1 Tax=Triparma columacea TaxID=722753 RepID=A0A9W7GFT1_9STRA|nr:hypothetical protein TrCOL_g3855 [Triparma columacea]